MIGAMTVRMPADVHVDPAGAVDDPGQRGDRRLGQRGQLGDVGGRDLGRPGRARRRPDRPRRAASTAARGSASSPCVRELPVDRSRPCHSTLQHGDRARPRPTSSAASAASVSAAVTGPTRGGHEREDQHAAVGGRDDAGQASTPRSGCRSWPAPARPRRAAGPPATNRSASVPSQSATGRSSITGRSADAAASPAAAPPTSADGASRSPAASPLPSVMPAPMSTPRPLSAARTPAAAPVNDAGWCSLIATWRARHLGDHVVGVLQHLVDELPVGRRLDGRQHLRAGRRAAARDLAWPAARGRPPARRRPRGRASRCGSVAVGASRPPSAITAVIAEA